VKTTTTTTTTKAISTQHGSQHIDANGMK